MYGEDILQSVCFRVRKWDEEGCMCGTPDKENEMEMVARSGKLNGEAYSSLASGVETEFLKVGK